MFEELNYPFDPELLLRKRTSLKRKLLAQEINWTDKRIAVLGGATTHDIVAYLELFLLRNGIRPAFYESEYGKYWEDAMFGNPELDAFSPDVVFLATGTYNIRQFPELKDSKDAVRAKLDAEYDRYEKMWNRLREKFGCVILQNNFEFPYARLLGNADGWDVHGQTRFVRELNIRFDRYAEAHGDFFINDICWQSAACGLDTWNSRKHWHLYKSPAALTLVPYISFNAANIIKALFGKNKKALVLDLDNTLWGGVIGDDGVEGIALGQDNSEGQAYSEFQRYVKRLGEMGVLLCVNSKNDEENALAGLNHPDSVLHPDDFVIIKANWNSKDGNLRDIVQTLNILPESVVFADDNPAEREIIRVGMPEVATPDLTTVEDYVRILDHNGYFETTSISQDDLHRAEMYHANILREESQHRFTDYTEYLKSLEMRAEIRRFEPLYLPRITQLTNKTNQFNLTTRRYQQQEIEQCMQDENRICLYGKLYDKFGDNGLVSVLIARCEGDVAEIELFLMSCRVLKRGFEQAMINRLIEEAKERGICRVRGVYLPTAKNKMVKDLYGELGFTLIGSNEDRSVWETNPATFSPHLHTIAIED